ncbi:MAG: CRISPR-associated protein Cst1 [Anaerolineales bacterium]
MLRYTGHPYIDIGVATITAFAKKRKPEELSEADLEDIADYMAQNYTVNPLRSFLTVAFPNSGFTQPAYFKEPDKQQKYAERILRAFRPNTPRANEADIFFNVPVSAVSLDVKGELPAGRAYRQHIPLLTGEEVINFFPYGEAGMPISGEALLAIQALPLGCAKVSGRLLAVHSDNPGITFFFAKKFLEQNRLAVHVAQQSGENAKLEEPRLRLRTLLIETLLDIAQKQKEFYEDERPFSISAYHFSNSGQGASLDIYHLPMQVISFLRVMLSADYQTAWGKIVQRAWETAPEPKKKGKKEVEKFIPRKNYLYEDLFQLPENARRFLRTYFLRVALKYAKMEPGDPRQTYSTRAEVDIVSWKITQEFLRRIMNMEQERIDQIRDMGDRLAEYVSSQNDKRFFQEFFTQNRYEYFRSRLLKANLAHVKRGNPPIVEFEPYVQVFEEGTELARSDWRLARDLVLIRMIERLHALNWFGQNPDALTEELLETEEENQ